MLDPRSDGKRVKWLHVQGWAKEWSLGCMNLRPAARGSQEAGFTQPRDNYLAPPCILNGRMSLSFSILNLNGSAGLHSELVVGGEGLHVLPHLHRHPGTDEIG